MLFRHFDLNRTLQIPKKRSGLPAQSTALPTFFIDGKNPVPTHPRDASRDVFSELPNS